MAVGFMLLKDRRRAANQLKIVSKLNWTPLFANEIEKCWLLLADIYIQESKYDRASDLLKKVIVVNRSCTKAFEYMGYINEKESNYLEAAENYAQCWALQKNSNPSIGFKLAFNRLKNKNYVGAIDICHEVLQKNPDYPKIKSEIMDKARSLIRV
jgi:tetratricopeptide repeat protein 21B